MTLVLVAGFSVQLALGRSSFAAPPLVHAQAVVFMGWVGIDLDVDAPHANAEYHCNQEYRCQHPPSIPDDEGCVGAKLVRASHCQSFQPTVATLQVALWFPDGQGGIRNRRVGEVCGLPLLAPLLVLALGCSSRAFTTIAFRVIGLPVWPCARGM